MIRATQVGAYAMMRRDLARLGREGLRLNAELSSGLRVTRGSDDPTAMAESVRARGDLARLERLARAHGVATDRLGRAESELSAAYDVLVSARELALQGGNTQGEESRQAMARGIEAAFDELVALGNATGAQGAMFAGFATDAPPFEVSGSFAAAPGDASTIVVNYVGTGDETPLEVYPGETVMTALPGDQVFLGAGGNGEDAFALLVRARDAVLAGDTDALQGDLEGLDRALETISLARSRVGTELARVQRAGQTNDQRSDALSIRLGDLVGADITETVALLAEHTRNYEATLAVTARTAGLDLLSFI